MPHSCAPNVRVDVEKNQNVDVEADAEGEADNKGKASASARVTGKVVANRIIKKGDVLSSFYIN